MKKTDVKTYYNDDYDVEDYAQAGWDMIACDAGFDDDYDIESVLESLGH